MLPSSFHRKCLPALVVAAFLVVLLLPAGAQEDAAAQVRGVEQKINAAYAANNLPLYFSFYAPDFTGWFPAGRTSLPAYKKQWTANIAAGNGMVSVQLQDLQVQVSPSGDAAVASYILHVKEHTQRGIADELYHETDVLFRRAGVWKVVEVHYSPVRRRRQAS